MRDEMKSNGTDASFRFYFFFFGDGWVCAQPAAANLSKVNEQVILFRWEIWNSCKRLSRRITIWLELKPIVWQAEGGKEMWSTREIRLVGLSSYVIFRLMAYGDVGRNKRIQTTHETAKESGVKIMNEWKWMWIRNTASVAVTSLRIPYALHSFIFASNIAIPFKTLMRIFQIKGNSALRSSGNALRHPNLNMTCCWNIHGSDSEQRLSACVFYTRLNEDEHFLRNESLLIKLFVPLLRIESLLYALYWCSRVT